MDEVLYRRCVRRSRAAGDAPPLTPRPCVAAPLRSMAQLFSFDRGTNGWADRGIGYASILRHRQSKQVRFLMQEEQSGRALANHMIDPTTRLEENVSSDRAWVFRALDYASGRGVDEVFALQFRTVEAARLFRQCFDKAREHMAALLAAAREVAAAAEQAHQHVSPSRPSRAAGGRADHAAPRSAAGRTPPSTGAVSEAAVAEAARQMGASPPARAKADRGGPPAQRQPPAAGATVGAEGAEEEVSEPAAEPAAAPEVPSPPAAAGGGSGGGRNRKLRRRLSVVNKHVAAEGSEADTLEMPAFFQVSADSPPAVASRLHSPLTPSPAPFQRSSTPTVPIYAAVSKKGEAPYGLKKQNQDALVVAEHGPTGSILLCVFDGHGEEGHRVSQYLRARIPDAVFQHPGFAEDPGAAMTDAVREVEQELIEDDGIDCRLSGSTAVMGIVRGKELTVANVGDSRITLAVGTKVPGRSGKLRTVIKAEAVSHDHKPESPEEKARIIEAGGRVFAIDYGDGEDGPQRVWLGDADIPGLAMARSVGDVVAKWAGVISTPEITTRTLASTDKFLVLASDGLWEFMDDQEVVDMVRSHRPRNCPPARLRLTPLPPTDPQELGPQRGAAGAVGRVQAAVDRTRAGDGRHQHCHRRAQGLASSRRAAPTARARARGRWASSLNRTSALCTTAAAASGDQSLPHTACRRALGKRRRRNHHSPPSTAVSVRM